MTDEHWALHARIRKWVYENGLGNGHEPSHLLRQARDSIAALASKLDDTHDERFDAGYQMAIEHCIRVCTLSRNVWGGEPTTPDHQVLIDSLIARMGLRAPQPERLSRTQVAAVSDKVQSDG